MISCRMITYPAKSKFVRPSARQWAQNLGRFFSRVAIFAINRTSAEVVAVHGLCHQSLGLSISLREKSPLRWAIEASSPIIGSGRSPGGANIAYALGIEIPRAYAIISLAMPGGIVGLAYCDSCEQPLSLEQINATFTFCHTTLSGEVLAISNNQQFIPQFNIRRSYVPLRVPRRNRPTATRNTANIEFVQNIAETAIDNDNADIQKDDLLTIETDVIHQEQISNDNALINDDNEQHQTNEELNLDLGESICSEIVHASLAPADIEKKEPIIPIVIDNVSESIKLQDNIICNTFINETELNSINDSKVIETELNHPNFLFSNVNIINDTQPQSIINLEKQSRNRAIKHVISSSLAASIAIAASLLLLVAPVSLSTTNTHTIVIAPNANLTSIAHELAAQGLIRSTTGFAWLARMTGAHRALRAGIYNLSANAWAW
ncbi:MAG: hypothetical protein JW841_14335, partial [Deltaproteobacteria bacterium]|nr:hypothetical protein [Deltaproteobacteria bacterium]